MIALRLMLVVGLVVGQVAVMTLGAPTKPAHALTTITQWTFDSSMTTPSTGLGTASLVCGTTATFATGNPGQAWNTTNYPGTTSNNQTAGVQFQISTTGWQDIEFSFDIRHSNTAANTVVVQYSTDGGASFTNVATYTVSQTSNPWYARTVDLSSYPAVNNISDLRVRVVAAFAPPTNTQYVASNPSSTYNTGGTLRFDNVTFRGNAISSGDVPPTVTAVTPPNGATNVPVNSNVVITFSEPVNVTGDWFSLACGTSGTRTPSASNVTVTGEAAAVFGNFA